MQPGTETFIASLANHLLTLRLTDESALARARRAQAKTGQRFDRVLTELGIVPERQLAEAIASVLGLVGAGGIGLALHDTLRLFDYGRSAALIVVMLATILIIDLSSTAIRGRLR